MPNKNKVIKGLEELRTELGYGLPDRSNVIIEYLNSLSDAIVLLKEQEHVEPITEHLLFLCPMCKKTLFRGQKYCYECGKRINWEGR